MFDLPDAKRYVCAPLCVITAFRGTIFLSAWGVC